jgi:ubiquinone/menaquinone biosynthesis C-methylase UbiE
MSRKIESHYLGHDIVYQRYKQAGRPGWADEKTLAENIYQLSRLIERLAPVPGSRILELGCGAGNLAIELARRGFSVTGVDISPTAIDWAKEKAASVLHRPDFIVGDVLKLPVVYDDFFDYVLDGYCFHCIIGGDRKVFLENAFRVLRAHGILHIATMCNGYRASELREKYDEQSRYMIFDGIASRYFGDADSILAEIISAGFSIAYQAVECGDASGQQILRVDCAKV